MDEKRVAELIDPALRGLGVRRAVREVQLQDAFAEVVGPALAPMCRAVSLERGRLLIETANTALAQQLHLDSGALMLRLNARIGDEHGVRRLAFAGMDGGGAHRNRRGAR